MDPRGARNCLLNFELQSERSDNSPAQFARLSVGLTEKTKTARFEGKEKLERMSKALVCTRFLMATNHSTTKYNVNYIQLRIGTTPSLSFSICTFSRV